MGRIRKGHEIDEYEDRARDVDGNRIPGCEIDTDEHRVSGDANHQDSRSPEHLLPAVDGKRARERHGDQDEGRQRGEGVDVTSPTTKESNRKVRSSTFCRFCGYLRAR